MKRWFTTCAVLLFLTAALRADVTIVQTTTVEGGMAAMAAQSGANMSPKVTSRIKGMKMRADVEAGMINIATIVDLDAKQIIVLHADQKTATVTTAAAPPAGATPPPQGPSVDSSMKPTGKTQVINGLKCDEYAITTTLDMGAMPNQPPEAAAMMQGMKLMIAGSMWVAKDVPGAAEYLAFQKAAAASDMATAAMGNSGMNLPGMEKMMKAMSSLSGVTYLSEMTMTIEGTGQIADMMRQMGPMKVTTKVDSISAAALADDLFKVPEGYTVSKQ